MKEADRATVPRTRSRDRPSRSGARFEHRAARTPFAISATSSRLTIQEPCAYRGPNCAENPESWCPGAGGLCKKPVCRALSQQCPLCNIDHLCHCCAPPAAHNGQALRVREWGHPQRKRQGGDDAARNSEMGAMRQMLVELENKQQQSTLEQADRSRAEIRELREQEAAQRAAGNRP